MNVERDIAKVREANRDRAEFKSQLERVRALRAKMGQSDAPVQDAGIDRSRELIPVRRPRMIRVLTGA